MIRLADRRFVFKEIFPLLLKLWLCFCFMILRDNYSLLSYAGRRHQCRSLFLSGDAFVPYIVLRIVSIVFLCGLLWLLSVIILSGCRTSSKAVSIYCFLCKSPACRIACDDSLQSNLGTDTLPGYGRCVTIRPWYVLFNRIGSSFPSGHTSSFVGSLLCLLGFPFPMIRKHHCLSCILAFALVVMMMISRMIMGAHFLS